MEILEPLGDYISTPTESSSTFFGANILDDCNELSYIKASFVKASNGEELCSCKVSQASNDAYSYGVGEITETCAPTNSCEITYVDGPTKTPSTDSQFTPYYSFKLSMDDTLISKLQNTDYKVVFESADKRGESTKATKEKTIRFNDQIDPSENTLKETPTRVELPITVAINTVTAKKCSDLQGTCSSPSSGCTTGYVYQTGTYSECQSGYGCCVKSS